MRKQTVITLGWMLALALVLGLSTAHADILYVGPAYTQSIVMDTNTPPLGTVSQLSASTLLPLAGGSIDPSTLNGEALPFLYCVDIPDNVYVGETYAATVVDNFGLVNNSPSQFGAENSGTFHQLPTIEVDQVAWLVDTYGVGGQGNPAVALQAAIWHVIYTTAASSFDLDPTANPAAYGIYHTEMTGLAAATTDGAIYNAAPILWLSPNPVANGLTIEQGLVTSLPEPSSILLLGLLATAVLGFLGLMKRRLA